jgi:activator of HSP90 ATPase
MKKISKKILKRKCITLFVYKLSLKVEVSNEDGIATMPNIH